MGETPAVERFYHWLYRRLGAHYLAGIMVIDVISALLITLGTLGILRLYVDATTGEFLRIVGFAELAVLLGVIFIVVSMWPVVRPLRKWLAGKGDHDATEVWRCAVQLPLEFVRRADRQGVLLVALPVSVFAVIELGLPFYSVAFLLLGGLVAIGYSAVLHFFYAETALSPVLDDLAERLPPDFAAPRLGVPLRWKLLGALPLINVITGVVVSGLSNGSRHSIQEIGVSVLVAIVVSFTIALELTVLVSRSVLRPVQSLLDATERVKRADYSVKVPVTSGDELGALALNFNQMVSGLAEREALHHAFGSYVDPQVAMRVLEEGARLEGEEVEVSVIFVDLRDFTSFAEHAGAREVVAYVNEFLELVVPLLTKHGGHANKFVGDGVLGVFGAPVRLPDHADRALAAAAELASAAEATGGRIRVGVGINSGKVLAGTIGGGEKLEFTVIGDPVNVAARVEGVTRRTGDVVLLTEATRRLLSSGHPPLEERGAIPLKGRSEAVPIFALALRGARLVQTSVIEGQGTSTGGKI
jgi:adenylate cyclase